MCSFTAGSQQTMSVHGICGCSGAATDSRSPVTASTSAGLGADNTTLVHAGRDEGHYKVLQLFIKIITIFQFLFLINQVHLYVNIRFFFYLQ